MAQRRAGQPEELSSVEEGRRKLSGKVGKSAKPRFKLATPTATAAGASNSDNGGNDPVVLDFGRQVQAQSSSPPEVQPQKGGARLRRAFWSACDEVIAFDFPTPVRSPAFRRRGHSRREGPTFQRPNSPRELSLLLLTESALSISRSWYGVPPLGGEGIPGEKVPHFNAPSARGAQPLSFNEVISFYACPKGTLGRAREVSHNGPKAPFPISGDTRLRRTSSLLPAPSHPLPFPHPLVDKGGFPVQIPAFERGASVAQWQSS